jgi:hypothetical protein
VNGPPIRAPASGGSVPPAGEQAAAMSASSGRKERTRARSFMALAALLCYGAPIKRFRWWGRQVAARLRLLMAAIALAAGTAPAAAQNFSNSYTFIKAVKDRDGAKVTSVLAEPGSTAAGAKETGTGNSALHLVALDRDYAG